MKNSAFLLLFLALAFGSRAQISKRQLLKDYDLFRRIYEKANAGLYKYHSREMIDSTFRVNRKRIQNGTSYREFYTVLWNVIDFTGSCHNDLTYPDSLKSTLQAQKIFFPLPLKFLAHKLYANCTVEGIPLGSEILSVNGVDAKTVAAEVSRFLSTDGSNITGKYTFLETKALFLNYYYAYGPQTTFEVLYKDSSGTHQTTLQATDYKSAVENYKRRFIPDYEKNTKSRYVFRYLADSETGLLTVNTFALGGPRSDGHKQYAAFLDSVFSDLKNKNVQNLIVDIRKNGGGDDPNDLLLYSYLTKRNFRENRSAYTLFNKVPLKKYYLEEEKGEIGELEEELKDEHSVLKNGKYYQHEKNNPVWTPKPQAFSGKIYLLISPFVASAGSLFASMVKSDDETVVIGQEALGGYYGHTGHIPVTYTLPETGLLLTFSLVDLEQDVQKLPDQTTGAGVKPDYTIEQTMEEYLSNSDSVLEFTKKVITR